MLRYITLLLALFALAAHGDDAAIKLHASGRDGTVRLEWTLPAGMKASALQVYRTDSPKGHAGKPLATLAAGEHEYLDTVSNWTPHYYRVTAPDGGAISNLAVGVARSRMSASPVETFAF